VCNLDLCSRVLHGSAAFVGCRDCVLQGAGLCTAGCSGFLACASVIDIIWIDLVDLSVKFFVCWQRDWT